MILFDPIFSYLLLTLEQQTPTNMTLIKLHDFAMMMSGKLTKYIASVWVMLENQIMKPVAAELFVSIFTLLSFGIVKKR